VREFKEKLKHYEIFRNDSNSKRSETENRKIEKRNNNKNQEVRRERTDIKCFNCGIKGHLSKECRNKDKGVKCFNCNKFGHIANNCQEKKESNMRHLHPEYFMNKEIKIQGQSFRALFDTGSKYNIISDDCFKRLKNLQLLNSNFYLIGFGKKNNRCFSLGNSIQAKLRFTCKSNNN